MKQLGGFVLAASLAAVNVGHAATILQAEGSSHAAILAYGPIGQSFIAEDAMLGSIAFAFSDINPGQLNEPVTMTLYQGEGFDGPVIGSTTQVLPATLPSIDDAPVLIDFSFSGTALSIGQTYTAAVTIDSSYKVAVVYAELDLYEIFEEVDLYTGGLMIFAGDSILLAGGDVCSAGLCPGADLVFRVTPVPEPAQWGMMLAGLGLVGWTARRRRMQRGLAAASNLN